MKKNRNHRQSIKIGNSSSEHELRKIFIKKVKSARLSLNSQLLIYSEGATLNSNIPWDNMIHKILSKNYTIHTLATKIRTNPIILKQVLRNDFKNLPFITGACILKLYMSLFDDVSVK